MTAARRYLLERAESYSQDARSLRESGDPDLAGFYAAYITIAEELRKTAELLGDDR